MAKIVKASGMEKSMRTPKGGDSGNEGAIDQTKVGTIEDPMRKKMLSATVAKDGDSSEASMLKKGYRCLGSGFDE